MANNLNLQFKNDKTLLIISLSFFVLALIMQAISFVINIVDDILSIYNFTFINFFYYFLYVIVRILFLSLSLNYLLNNNKEKTTILFSIISMISLLIYIFLISGMNGTSQVIELFSPLIVIVLFIFNLILFETKKKNGLKYFFLIFATILVAIQLFIIIFAYGVTNFRVDYLLFLFSSLGFLFLIIFNFSLLRQERALIKEQAIEEKLNVYKLSIETALILSIFTFGIYAIVWYYKLIKTLKYIKTSSHKDCGKDLLLILFIPLYHLIWLYKQEKDFYLIRSKKKISKDNSILYLVLSIFGLGFVGMLLLRNETNSYLDIQDDDDLLISELSLEEKLRELKDLYSKELINDDEYRLAKEKLLNL